MFLGKVTLKIGQEKCFLKINLCTYMIKNLNERSPYKKELFLSKL